MQQYHPRSCCAAADNIETKEACTSVACLFLFTFLHGAVYYVVHMRIDILTIFPDVVRPYTDAAMMKRAQQAGAVAFGVTDLRDFSADKWRRVDDTPYGGGAGMVMQVAPIHGAVQHLTAAVPDVSAEKRRIILLSAKGRQYTQKDARRLASYAHLILICGRYEGVDERVAQHIADEEVAVGPYVLTGGELGALTIADSVVRLLSGVLGNEASAVEESHATEGYTEYPHYTKPDVYNGWRVPDVLVSGDHAKIEAWRIRHSNHHNNDQTQACGDESRTQEKQE